MDLEDFPGQEEGRYGLSSSKIFFSKQSVLSWFF